MPTARYYPGPELGGPPPPYPCVQPVAAAASPMTLRANLFTTSRGSGQTVPAEEDFVFGTDFRTCVPRPRHASVGFVDDPDGSVYRRLAPVDVRLGFVYRRLAPVTKPSALYTGASLP